MSTTNHALIILWNGKDMPDHVVTEIVQYMHSAGVCIPELTKAIYKDQKGIVDSIIRDVDKTCLKVDIQEDEQQEAIKQSVIYIGERFSKYLKGTVRPNVLNFAMAITEAVSKARVNVGANPSAENEYDKALLNAVEIIATARDRIPASVARKYNITTNIVSVISQVYYQFT